MNINDLCSPPKPKHLSTVLFDAISPDLPEDSFKAKKCWTDSCELEVGF